MSGSDQGPQHGWELLGAAIAHQGYSEFFYIMGGPIVDAAAAAIRAGSRGIDVRHESAAVMAAHAAARTSRRPAVCMAASGPAAANLVPGLANAYVDGAPVIAIGGASPLSDAHRGAFQEVDQLAMMQGIVKHAERIHDPGRIPERLQHAARIAMSGRPGPVYLELPGDVLYEEANPVPDLGPSMPWWPRPGAARASEIEQVISLLDSAERPLMVVGSGILWSQAAHELRGFADDFGVPVYSTPQVRGALPDDHPLAFPAARSLAFREADLLLVVGTRMNYVWSHFGPPRFDETAKIVQIDADPGQIATARDVDVAIVADAKEALVQLRDAGGPGNRFDKWTDRLAAKAAERQHPTEAAIGTQDGVIHPARLCLAIKESLARDDVLVVDGQEILAFARQGIPAYELGNCLNSGTFGTMGVGIPYGIGAAVARPDARVVVVTGDGALGFSFMELDTVARHGLNLTVVVSLNGGHTADPEQKKPGRNLGYTKYHELAGSLGWDAAYVEDESELPKALEQALSSESCALVNVVTDWRAGATQARFTSYHT